MSAADRDQTARIYARLKEAYDRIIYDPAGLSRRPELVPSHFPDGDPDTLLSLGDSRSSLRSGDGYRGAFPSSGNLWRHDLSPRQRIAIVMAILLALLIVLVAGLAIAQTLSRLISG